MRSTTHWRNAVLLIGATLLMGAEDPGGCSAGNQYLYTCECWTSASAGFTVGTPSPCGQDDEDALSQARAECTAEVGDDCDCTCATGGKSCH